MKAVPDGPAIMLAGALGTVERAAALSAYVGVVIKTASTAEGTPAEIADAITQAASAWHDMNGILEAALTHLREQAWLTGAALTAAGDQRFAEGIEHCRASHGQDDPLPVAAGGKAVPRQHRRARLTVLPVILIAAAAAAASLTPSPRTAAPGALALAAASAGAVCVHHGCIPSRTSAASRVPQGHSRRRRVLVRAGVTA